MAARTRAAPAHWIPSMGGRESKNRTSGLASTFRPPLSRECASRDQAWLTMAHVTRSGLDGRGWRLQGEHAVVHAGQPQERYPAIGELLQALMEPDVASLPEEPETEE